MYMPAETWPYISFHQRRAMKILSSIWSSAGKSWKDKARASNSVNQQLTNPQFKKKPDIRK